MIDYGKFRLSPERLREQYANYRQLDPLLPEVTRAAVAESVVHRFETCYDCDPRPFPPPTRPPLLRPLGAEAVVAQRQAVLDAAWARNPERFRRAGSRASFVSEPAIRGLKTARRRRSWADAEREIRPAGGLGAITRNVHPDATLDFSSDRICGIVIVPTSTGPDEPVRRRLKGEVET